jgi:type I restriction enzyme R subunit
MFLTWFDSKTLNTLYVDKNLKYHWLIQAFSRTNRILNEQKSQWNIICFRNLKHNVDEAIRLFSNPEAKEIILMDSYESYKNKFNKSLENLYKIAPNFDSVNDLVWEYEQLQFIQSFRELIRILNILKTFADFDFEHLNINEQDFSNYQGKYLDIYNNVKNITEKEKVSILDDVDFELELIITDNINVDYILNLLAQLIESNSIKHKE